MIGRKKNEEEEHKQKTYTIKMPVYTTSIIEKENDLLGAMTYSDLVDTLKVLIANCQLPISY